MHENLAKNNLEIIDGLSTPEALIAIQGEGDENNELVLPAFTHKSVSENVNFYLNTDGSCKDGSGVILSSSNYLVTGGREYFTALFNALFETAAANPDNNCLIAFRTSNGTHFYITNLSNHFSQSGSTYDNYYFKSKWRESGLNTGTELKWAEDSYKSVLLEDNFTIWNEPYINNSVNDINNNFLVKIAPITKILDSSIDDIEVVFGKKNWFGADML